MLRYFGTSRPTRCRCARRTDRGLSFLGIIGAVGTARNLKGSPYGTRVTSLERGGLRGKIVFTP
jgi:hypothetical protein